MDNFSLHQKSAQPPPRPGFCSVKVAVAMIAEIIAPAATDPVDALKAKTRAPAVLAGRAASGDLVIWLHDPEARNFGDPSFQRIGDADLWISSIGRRQLAEGFVERGNGGMLDPKRQCWLYVETRGILNYRIVADRVRDHAARLGCDIDLVLATYQDAAFQTHCPPPIAGERVSAAPRPAGTSSPPTARGELAGTTMSDELDMDIDIEMPSSASEQERQEPKIEPAQLETITVETWLLDMKVKWDGRPPSADQAWAEYQAVSGAHALSDD